ncbi:MAG: hypothetical protein KGK30_10075, partial [Elusimicrobia bacterium]|nr:hypothetical protein [Elusimicrobiota bacterium]
PAASAAPAFEADPTPDATAPTHPAAAAAHAHGIGIVNFCASPTLDFTLLHGLGPEVASIDTEALAQPARQAAGSLSAAPLRAKLPEIEAAATKAALLSTVFGRFLYPDQEAGIAQLARSSLSRLPKDRQELVFERARAIARELGYPESYSADLPDSAAFERSASAKATTLVKPEDRENVNRRGFAPVPDPLRKQTFRLWKAQRSLRRQTASVSDDDKIVLGFLGISLATTAGLFVYEPNAMAPLLFGGLTISVLQRLISMFRASRARGRAIAANAAADAAELRLGIPVSADEIPTSPEEVEQARALYRQAGSRRAYR